MRPSIFTQQWTTTSVHLREHTISIRYTDDFDHMKLHCRLSLRQLYYVNSLAQIKPLRGLDRDEQLLKQCFFVSVRWQLQQIEACACSRQSPLVRGVANMAPHVDGDWWMQVHEAEQRRPACWMPVCEYRSILRQREDTT